MRKATLAMLAAMAPMGLASLEAACAAEDQAQAPRKLIATEGKGYLETVDGYPVLHLKGTPEEMGCQHGLLLKKSVQANVSHLLNTDPEADVSLGRHKVPRRMIAGVLNVAFENKIPERFEREMKALAEAAEVPYWKVRAANLIPEAFHCSGFALLKEATAEGKLYHGRVLDYAVDWKLQDHAVLILQEPEGRIAFANVSYAGFIGSVTGMNVRQVSIGEMGGGGWGQWRGIPMAFLVRMVLSEAATLEQAVGVFRNNHRTCEYYYVIADAKADDAVGMRATPDELELVRPGQKHRLLPSPVPHTVLLSAGTRYQHLSRLAARGAGRFTQASAIRLMDAPVAMKANLHNVLMVPGDGVLHVANADPAGQPAWKRKYYRFDIRQLLRTRPAEGK
jgi:hypothetical protein